MSQENNFIPNQKQYKPLSPFKLFVKSNFPFIEATFEALDNYGLYCKIVEYLNTVISNEKDVEDNVLALYNAFVSLNNYVSNYFDNLDVQEEINNKLDDMAEAGTLEEIISSYLNSTAIFGFDNVEEMTEAQNLINGSFARTMGYYSKNDGGNGLYKIRTRTFDDVIDNGSIIEMENENLIAELIVKNSVNAKQFGAKGDGLTDDTTALQNFVDYELIRNKIIPNGTYLVTNIIYITKMQNIKGEKKELTSIKASGELTSYIIDICYSNVTIENIVFDCNNLSGGVLIRDLKNQNPDLTRIGGSRLHHCTITKIGTNKIGALLDCACGYNYFDNVRFTENYNTCNCLQIGKDYSGTYSGGALEPNYIYIEKCNFNGNESERTNVVNYIVINFGLYIYLRENDFAYLLNADSYILKVTGLRRCGFIHSISDNYYNFSNAIFIERPNSSGVSSFTFNDCEFLQNTTYGNKIININDGDTNNNNVTNFSFINNNVNIQHEISNVIDLVKARNINFQDNKIFRNSGNQNLYPLCHFAGCTWISDNLLYKSIRVTSTFTSGTPNTYTVTLSGNTTYYTQSVTNNILTLTYTACNALSFLTYRQALLTDVNNTSSSPRINSVSASETDGTITVKIILPDNTVNFNVAII